MAVDITLKLFATLTDYIPRGRDGARNRNELPLEVEEGTTVQAVIDAFRVPPAMAHIVLVNGVFVPRPARTTQALQPGDALAVWPPIAGG
ncbi:MAG: MoaD/ThiS family protein [Casimicrobiaceae bacterium]